MHFATRKLLTLALALAPLAASSAWVPAATTTWQYQLSGTVDRSLNVDMYVVDLFDNSAEVVADLHKRKNGTTKVVCYLSAGTYEDWRPDADQFPAEALGRRNGWPGERWLDIRHPRVIEIMRSRMDLCKAKGFDAVEADNVDGYANVTGFPLTSAHQLAFNRLLAKEAHARGLSIGLKNDLDQVVDLVDDFDFAINEQCFEYNECKLLDPFVMKGKAVFHVEYRLATARFCSKANARGFNSMRKRTSLNAWREPCR